MMVDGRPRDGAEVCSFRPPPSWDTGLSVFSSEAFKVDIALSLEGMTPSDLVRVVDVAERQIAEIEAAGGPPPDQAEEWEAAVAEIRAARAALETDELGFPFLGAAVVLAAAGVIAMTWDAFRGAIRAGTNVVVWSGVILAVYYMNRIMGTGSRYVRKGIKGGFDRLDAYLSERRSRRTSSPDWDIEDPPRIGSHEGGPRGW